ncbi:MAG: hypothetical protein ABJA67_07315, partial [Chthonomonadales bacterium]
KYRSLTESEIKALIVDDKWLATINEAIQSEVDRLSQTITGRIRQLAERYATPLPKQLDDLTAAEQKVNAHLKQMGFIWN